MKNPKHFTPIVAKIGFKWSFIKGLTIFFFFFFFFYFCICTSNAETYSKYGVQLTIPNGGRVTKGSSEQYLWWITYYSFTADFKVGIAKNNRLQYIIPAAPKPFESTSKFNIQSNQEFAKKAHKIYYHQYEAYGNQMKSAILVIKLSEIISLVYLVDFKATEFEKNMEVLSKVIESTKLVPNQNEGKLTTTSVGSKLFQIHTIESEFFIQGAKGTGPRLRNGKNQNELLLVWSDAADNYHVTVLNKKGVLIKDYNFGNKAIYDAVAHLDGFAVLEGKPRHNLDASEYQSDYEYSYLNLVKYTWSHKPIFNTLLMGVDQIENVGDQSFKYWGRTSTQLAWSGEYYAAHFSTYKKWPDLVTHQADAFLVLDKKGNRLDVLDTNNHHSCTWCVSHSFAQELLFDGEKFMRFSLGDAYPRAISVRRSYPEKRGSYSLKQDQFLPFPGKTGNNYVYDTRFGNALAVEDGVCFAYDTELEVGGSVMNPYSEDLCNDLFVQKVNFSAEAEGKYRLTNSPKVDEGQLSIAIIDNDHLLCKWRAYHHNFENEEFDGVKGTVGEMMGIYNLKFMKWETETPLKFKLAESILEHFILENGEDQFVNNLVDNSTFYLSSRLFTDSEGRIWFVRFKTNNTGIELVEVMK